MDSDAMDAVETLKSRAKRFPTLRDPHDRAEWLAKTLEKRWGIKKHGMAKVISTVLDIPYSKSCKIVAGQPSDTVTNAQLAIVFDFWLVNWLYKEIDEYMDFWADGNRGRTVKELLMGTTNQSIEENDLQWEQSVSKAVDFVNYQLINEEIIDPHDHTLRVSDEFIDYYTARLLNTCKLIKIELEGGSIFDVNRDRQRTLHKRNWDLRQLGRKL